MTSEGLQEFLATIPAMQVEKQVKLFVKMRDAKSALTKKYDADKAEIESIMSMCENMMLKKADEQGVEGFKTPFGTTYTSTTTKISIADDEAFFKFVMDQQDLGFFERRVSSKHVENFIENQMEAAKKVGTPEALAAVSPPPGLNLFKERVMRVRKAAEK